MNNSHFRFFIIYKKNMKGVQIFMALIDKYTKEELEQIVQQSASLREILKKMGYTSCSGDTYKVIKEKFDNLGISYNHFEKQIPTKRTEENIFIENSTAAQHTLRSWYLKGEYTPYICSICGQPPEWQGKELTLILDHINGHNKDNRLENLRWVCPNCNQQLDTTGSKRGFSHLKEVKKYYCVDCGKEITKKSARCQDCESKRRKQQAIDNSVVTREELKNLIRTMPFTQIGVQVGVSDNAIRKWCDRFNLPRKKSDINKYSDEEWELI